MKLTLLKKKIAVAIEATIPLLRPFGQFSLILITRIIILPYWSFLKCFPYFLKTKMKVNVTLDFEAV